MTISTREIQQARKAIYDRGLNSTDISPKLLALTAKRTKKTFADLLSFIAILKTRGQGRGEAPEAQSLAGDS